MQFKKITMIEDVLFNIEVFRTIDSCNQIAKTLYRYAIRKKGSLTTKYLPDYFELHEKRVRVCASFTKIGIWKHQKN